VAYRKKAYAPFSLSSEAGNTVQPVDGYIEVDQYIQPTVNTGVIDENGTWRGSKASDSEFIGFSFEAGIADGTTFLVPNTVNHPSIDMEGFKGLQIALRVATGTGSGNCAIKAVVGPETSNFLNLKELEPAIDIRMVPFNNTTANFELAVNDSSETIYSKWRVFTVYDVLADVQNVQFVITNNIGGNRDFHFAFRRLA
jgi:hypothetical protein